MPGMDAMPMEMGESPGGIDKKLSGNHNQKTRFFIKPNLMQLHSSYVVTDPKGTVLVECGKLLSRGAPRLGKDGKPLRNKKGRRIVALRQFVLGSTCRKICRFSGFAAAPLRGNFAKIGGKRIETDTTQWQSRKKRNL